MLGELTAELDRVEPGALAGGRLSLRPYATARRCP
jgi:hypothetical protein